MKAGDHIRVRRRFYWHHGIDLGDGTVVHMSGEPKRKRDATVRRDTREVFLCGGTAETVGHPDALPPESVVQRALSRLDESTYSLLFHNCEHFACWCMGVNDRDTQVHRAARNGVVVGIGLRIAAALAGRSGAAVAASRFVPVLAPLGYAAALAGASVRVASMMRRASRKDCLKTTWDRHLACPSTIQSRRFLRRQAPLEAG